MDKALLNSFAARAEQKKKSRMEVKPFEIPGVGKVAFTKLGYSASVGLMGRMAEASENGAEGYADICNAQAEMIYDCCPTLQDPELHKELGAEADPYSVVPMLMDVKEITVLADDLARWMGFSEDKAKNLSGAIR